MQTERPEATEPLFRTSALGWFPFSIGCVVCPANIALFLAAAASDARHGTLGWRDIGIIPFSVCLMVWMIGIMRLTVTVDRERVHWSFIPGWIRGALALSDIVSMKAYRTVGLHAEPFPLVGDEVVTPGCDGAVELRLRNGRSLRLGTNDANGLLEALESARRGALA